MVYAMEHLGFVVTMNTSYEALLSLAHRLSTLDRLIKAPISWNHVTRYRNSVARSLGLEKVVKHDSCYDAAEEYLEELN